MALYKATKNLFFSSLNKSVIVDETIELDKEYADKINNDLKLTFPDVQAVLVVVDVLGELNEVEKPKKPSTRGKKTTETDTVEVAAE